MTKTAKEIYDLLYAESVGGTLHESVFWNHKPYSSVFPDALIVISSDEKYAAKIDLGRASSSGSTNYGLADPRNFFRGIDIEGEVELYYNDSGVQISILELFIQTYQ